MIEEVKNPRWVNSKKEQIIVDVLASGEWFPFVATPDDCTTHGPMLYNFALKGIFGEIKDSDEERIVRGDIPPPEGFIVKDGKIIDLAEAEVEAQAKLDRLLAGLNTEEAKAQAEVDEDFAAERKEKIKALLAVKSQKGWPLDVEWPL